MANRQRQVGGRKEAPLAVVGSGNDSKALVPLSPLETLIQAHPDFSVERDRLGEVTIGQALRNGDFRRVEVVVSHGKEGNPTVVVIGQQIPASYKAEVHVAGTKMRQAGHTLEDVSRYYDLQNRSFHALRTYVKVRITEDERVHAEIAYNDWMTQEGLTMKVDPHELVTTARRGLELLQAYVNDPTPKFGRIEQIEDEYRPGLERDMAEASPLLGEFMRRDGISYSHADSQLIYALNTLNKVTGGMLPAEMPPVPPNKLERRRRRTQELIAPRPLSVPRR